jgi:hypothetical protein
MNHFGKIVNSVNSDSIARAIVDDILNIIKRLSQKRQIEITLSYSKFGNIQVHLSVKRGRPSISSAGWEKRNFERFGVYLDANTYVPSNGSPGIDLKIVIDPLSENTAHESLNHLLLDTVRHEIEHIKTADPSGFRQRSLHASSYKYFLLDDEVPAAVAGLKLLAVERGISLVDAIHDYLKPFVDSNFMTPDQSIEVSSAWLNYASRN